jgi:hypothetical protein
MNTVLYCRERKNCVADPDPFHIESHIFEKPYPDPHQLQSKKPDQNGAMEGLVCSQQRHEAQNEAKEGL